MQRLAITHHHEARIGNIIFKEPSIVWRRDPLENSVFADENSFFDFAAFLSDVGLECGVEVDRVPPCLKLNYLGRPIYGYVARSKGLEILEGATKEEIEAITMPISYKTAL